MLILHIKSGKNLTEFKIDANSNSNVQFMCLNLYLNWLQQIMNDAFPMRILRFVFDMYFNWHRHFYISIRSTMMRQTWCEIITIENEHIIYKILKKNWLILLLWLLLNWCRKSEYLHIVCCKYWNFTNIKISSISKFVSIRMNQYHWNINVTGVLSSVLTLDENCYMNYN